MTRNRTITQFFHLAYCILCGVTMVATPSHAFETHTTDNERGVFAFFQTAETPIDYDYWIKSRPSYHAIPPHLQRDAFMSERLRLGYGYGAFDAANDVLTVDMDVVMRYNTATEDTPPTLTHRVFGHKAGKMPPVHFTYGEDIISLFIKNLTSFASMDMTPAQAQKIAQNVPYDDDDFDATLTLHVIVRDADSETPKLHKNGHKQYAMTGEIAYIQSKLSPHYSGGTEIVLWDYVAPWYAETHRINTTPEEERYPHPFDLFKD